MPKVAVIGFEGYVGSEVYKALLADASNEIFGVNRENYEENKSGNYDFVINCAMPSGRYWAKNNPELDFKETVKKTADLFYGWNFKKFIQISTVSARCQIDTVYGRHKKAAEVVCGTPNNLIIRLGALFGGDLSKGVLVDMLNHKKVFVHPESRYSFISVEFCSKWIVNNLNQTGIAELGGKNALSLKKVAEHLGAKIEFEGELNHQDILDEASGMPEASEVLNYLDKISEKYRK